MKLSNISKLVSPDMLTQLGSSLNPEPVGGEKPAWVGRVGKLFEEVDLGVTDKTINAALDEVQKIEGGWSDDPDDRGGKTNRGITLKFLQSVRPEATEDDLRNLSHEDARGLLRSEFVDKVGIGKLPDRAQAEAIGLAINAGPGRAVRALQRAAGVKEDGVIGPQTIAAVEKLSGAQVKQAIDDYYIDLVQKNPSQRKFLAGWLNRSERLASIPEDLNG